MKSMPAWRIDDESWTIYWKDHHLADARFVLPKNAYIAGREWSKRTGQRVRVFYDGYRWRLETIEGRK